jgi:hypothetical protein
MDTFEMSGDRTPLGDMTNIISGCQNSSNTRLQLIDRKECKRARERARYASMSLDQRNDKKRNVMNPSKDRKVIHPIIFRWVL